MRSPVITKTSAVTSSEAIAIAVPATRCAFRLRLAPSTPAAPTWDCKRGRNARQKGEGAQSRLHYGRGLDFSKRRISKEQNANVVNDW